MRCFRIFAVSLLLICAIVAIAKDKKKKIVLPEDVLEARTVLVVVDPAAGIAIDAPNANHQALENVENALESWGRFRLVSSEYNADLVISVRKGNGKIAQPTIGGVPDHRPVIVEPTNDANLQNPPTPGIQPQHRPDPHPQTEIGPPEDIFAVYRGKRENPTDNPPVWRFTGKDALGPPGAPAVDAFRKLTVEAEKQRDANP